MRQTVLPWMLIVAAVLLQVTVVASASIGSLSADVVTLVVVALAVLQGSTRGAIYGFSAGMLLALAVGGPLGPAALVATLVGYFSGRVGEGIVTGQQWIAPLTAGMAGTLAMHIGVPLLDVLLLQSGSGVSAIAVTGSFAVNTLLAVPIYALVARVLAIDTNARAAASTVTGTLRRQLRRRRELSHGGGPS